MSIILGKPREPLSPLPEQRLGQILRLYLHLANDPWKPLIAHSVYVHDVGDLLAEVARLKDCGQLTTPRETGEAVAENDEAQP